MKIAAIDQGTTSTRGLVTDGRGSAEIVRSLRHRQIRPGHGWVEHDPLELLENVRSCLEAVGAVDAIGIDNQGESCLAWDAETGQPISPVIVWQDNRTKDYIDRLRKDGCEETTLSRAGLPLDPYFSASKLSWIMANIPEATSLLRKGRLRLGTTDAFLLDRLAGKFVTDATTASRTSLMNLETLSWDAELCRLFSVPQEALPAIGPTAGTELGCLGKIPITASVVDQQAALYGHGCRKEGDAKITFGTGAFALVVTGSRIVRSSELGLLPTVAWRTPSETVYAVDGGVYDAGSVVEWLTRLELVRSIHDIAEFTGPSAIERGLVFVPALSGLACPYWDRSAAGMWIGMSADTTRNDLCQAALEGVALLTTRVIDTIRTKIDMTEPVSIDGGLTRSSYFTEFLAQALGLTVRLQQFDELTSFGCAALAALALTDSHFIPWEQSVIVESQNLDRSSWRSRFDDATARSRRWRAM
jgi:glycerol kinase